MSDANTSPSLRTVIKTDRIGVGVSAVCLAHCLAFPILLATLPLWPLTETLHEGLHIFFSLIILPISVVAMRSGYQLHGKKRVLFYFGAGLALIGVGIIWGHDIAGLYGEIGLPLVGSGLLISGHLQNSRLGRRCKPCDKSCKVC